MNAFLIAFFLPWLTATSSIPDRILGLTVAQSHTLSVTPPELYDGTQIGDHKKAQGNLLSVAELLEHSEDYHLKLIRLRGVVKRLELHLDETEHFIDFVFFLQEEGEHVLVFGRHDRTQGDIQLTSDHMVEVEGIFWKERIANGYTLKNNVEAQHINFYPPLISDQA